CIEASAPPLPFQQYPTAYSIRVDNQKIGPGVAVILAVSTVAERLGQIRTLLGLCSLEIAISSKFFVKAGWMSYKFNDCSFYTPETQHDELRKGIEEFIQCMEERPSSSSTVAIARFRIPDSTTYITKCGTQTQKSIEYLCQVATASPAMIAFLCDNVASIEDLFHELL
ncbi:hypothetical protein FRC03_007343, partial [Tulasnella sp. 419]